MASPSPVYADQLKRTTGQPLFVPEGKWKMQKWKNGEFLHVTEHKSDWTAFGHHLGQTNGREDDVSACSPRRECRWLVVQHECGPLISDGRPGQAGCTLFKRISCASDTRVMLAEWEEERECRDWIILCTLTLEALARSVACVALLRGVRPLASAASLLRLWRADSVSASLFYTPALLLRGLDLPLLINCGNNTIDRQVPHPPLQ